MGGTLLWALLTNGEKNVLALEKCRALEERDRQAEGPPQGVSAMTGVRVAKGTHSSRRAQAGGGEPAGRLFPCPSQRVCKSRLQQTLSEVTSSSQAG